MKNYSLIEIDKDENQGFHKVYAHTEKSFYVIDGMWETNVEEESLKKILSKFHGELLLVTQEFPDSVLVGCVSMTPKTKALEFMDYIFGSFGLIKGNAEYAQGRMSTVLLKVNIKDSEIGSTCEYFMDRANSYFEDLECIIAGNYIADNKDNLLPMSKYVKKNVPWAYVKSTDIASAGTLLRIKSLENDTGFEVKSSDSLYIMIGCLGEIYEITEDKFKRTYIESLEELDIFEKMFDFIPAVELVETNEYIVIDEKAHLCYPKRDTVIYARPLKGRTKVFRKGGLDYFTGQKGDYLAVRADDLKDIYIIQEEVFLKTYEKLESEDNL